MIKILQSGISYKVRTSACRDYFAWYPVPKAIGMIRNLFYKLSDADQARHDNLESTSNPGSKGSNFRPGGTTNKTILIYQYSLTHTIEVHQLYF